jgi:hypothetical protein
MSEVSTHFLFSATEAFGLFRRGVVVRGTVLQGSLRVGHRVVLPGKFKEHSARVASIELKRMLIEQTVQGVEIGLLLTQFEDPNLAWIIESGGDFPDSDHPSPQEISRAQFSAPYSRLASISVLMSGARLSLATLD